MNSWNESPYINKGKSPVLSPDGNPEAMRHAQKVVDTLLNVSQTFLTKQFEKEIENTRAYCENSGRGSQIALVYKDLLISLRNIEKKNRIIETNREWREFIKEVSMVLNTADEAKNKIHMEATRHLKKTIKAYEHKNCDNLKESDMEDIIEAMYRLRDCVAEEFYTLNPLNAQNIKHNEKKVKKFIASEWKLLSQMADTVDNEINNFNSSVKNSIDKRFLSSIDYFQRCISTYMFVAKEILQEVENDTGHSLLSSKHHDLCQDYEQRQKRLLSELQSNRNRSKLTDVDESTMGWLKQILMTKTPQDRIMNVIHTRGEMYASIGQLGTFTVN